ncbi:TQXA domain-containing protein [Sanguibacter sp. HDW7]|uniref:TQXA domain-containing protein n=1 Tax=Sanguibacter sp. HDW7 TaxID=2714931 RepID=UPI00140CEE1A|nr:TQXA domain-containing protein [Sanguibacter sp. HDW7]QIK84077.1 TQXA domain-containing protein [Sanguibacter sp. HDW7]
METSRTAPARSRTHARRHLATCASALLVGILTAAPVAVAPGAGAAPGDRATLYASGITAGTPVRLVGETVDRPTASYGLTGAPAGTSSDGYSLDASAVAPTGTTTYTEHTWADGASTGAVAAEGAVEKILTSSFPRVSATALGTAAGAGTPALTEAKARAATQAALWYVTGGPALDTTRRPDLASVTTADGTTSAPGHDPANLLPDAVTPGWTAGEPGTATLTLRINATLTPAALEITSTDGDAAAAPRVLQLLRWNTTTSTWASLGSRTLSGTGGGATSEFPGGTRTVRTWTGNWASTGYGASDTYQLKVTAKDPSRAVELGGVRLLATPEHVNDSQVVAAYRYLVAAARGATPSQSAEPAVALKGRERSAVAPGEPVGPFTVVSDLPVTLTLGGDDRATTRIVDGSGTTVAGSVEPGTQVWLVDARTVPLDATVTLTATTASVTTTNAVVRKGVTSDASARAPLSGLRTVTRSATTTFPVAWTLDAGAGTDIDLAGGATTRAFTYRYPLEASATESTVIWSDGTTSPTDLFRVSATDGSSADAYSVDLTRNRLIGENRRYTETDWVEGGNPAAHDNEAEIAWILAHSYPRVSTSTLSDRLRTADPSFGTANVRTWNAIAATQAALWHFSDDARLDTTRLGVPRTVTADSTGAGDAADLVSSDPAAGWRGTSETAALTITLPYRTRLTSYTVTTLEGGSAGSAPAVWRLQRSTTGADGTWVDVSTSSVSLSGSDRFPGGEARSRTQNLGSSATYGDGTGYRFYRLLVTATGDGSPVELGSVRFGTPVPSVNEPQVLALYEHLVAGANAAATGYLAPDPTVDVVVPAAATVAHDGRVGPFSLEGSRARVVATADGGRLGVGIIDADGRPVGPDLAAGTSFYLTPGDLAGRERYDGADVSVSLEITGTYRDRLAARALTTSDGTRETLVVLGVSSARATTSSTAAWRVAPSTTQVPTPTASPTATQVPTPTASPTATLAPSPTPTHVPEPTHTATAEPTATATPVPTATPAPAPAPATTPAGSDDPATPDPTTPADPTTTATPTTTEADALPVSGSSTTPLAVLTAALLGAGATVVLTARRRTSRTG